MDYEKKDKEELDLVKGDASRVFQVIQPLVICGTSTSARLNCFADVLHVQAVKEDGGDRG